MTEDAIRQRHFVDQLGVLFDRSGASVTMGRIVGHLLICEPPEQSLTQIAEGLSISKAAASTTTRQLDQLGLVVRVPSPPGARSTWYRVRSHAWTEILREQIALTQLFVDIADAGLVSLADAPESRKDRLKDLREFYVTLIEELQDFTRRYERERAAPNAKERGREARRKPS